MLSIIICNVDESFLLRCLKSIEETVSIPYEIIPFDNSISKVSITKAYNISASKAKYENLVFVHEDVEFLENGWGERLISILENNKIGIVGIAGSTYLPSVPSGWYLPNENLNNVYIHQGFKHSKKEVRIDKMGEDLTPVYLLDGVFLAMRKEVWNEFKFNENLKGFHAYDVDISQRVSIKYQNIFTNQVELLHHSEGRVDLSYYISLLEYKKEQLSYSYPSRNYSLEYQIIQSLILNLNHYFDKKTCVSLIKPFVKVKYLGIKGCLLLWFFINIDFINDNSIVKMFKK